ncbi:MAG: chaperone modulator CbpM [Candidatus Binataceae bacterium]
MARRSIRKRNPGGTATLASRAAFCVLSGINEYQLTLWEHEELITPATIAAVDGEPEPLYDAAALRRVRLIRTLAEDLEVNIPGIGVILHLLEQMDR